MNTNSNIISYRIKRDSQTETERRLRQADRNKD